jgi:hypothetical protein
MAAAARDHCRGWNQRQTQRQWIGAGGMRDLVDEGSRAMTAAG